MLCVCYKPEVLKEGWSRDRMMAEINTLGVPCFSGSCSEVYLARIIHKKGESRLTH